MCKDIRVSGEEISYVDKLKINVWAPFLLYGMEAVSPTAPTNSELNSDYTYSSAIIQNFLNLS